LDYIKSKEEEVRWYGLSPHCSTYWRSNMKSGKMAEGEKGGLIHFDPLPSAKQTPQTKACPKNKYHIHLHNRELE